MKITLTGSLGNITKPLAERLIAGGHQVNIISSKPGKAKRIEELGATPLIGSVEDAHFLLSSFQGSEAVYLMIPPNFNVSDYKQFTINVGNNYAQAIKKAGIKYMVNLSSVGSALAGKAPLLAYQNLERWPDQLPEINVVHLRPAGFYSNFYASMGLIKQQGIMGNNFGGDVSMVMSHPQDIAEAAAEALDSLSFRGKNVVNIISDSKTGNEIASLLGQATSQPDLKWIQFSDQQLLETLLGNGFSPHAAQHYIVDMGIAIREGLLERHYRQSTEKVFGKRSFSEFAKEFAQAYKQSKLTE